jgi:hypothetical protein
MKVREETPFPEPVEHMSQMLPVPVPQKSASSSMPSSRPAIPANRWRKQTIQTLNSSAAMKQQRKWKMGLNRDTRIQS